jgi:hypothetical protein
VCAGFGVVLVVLFLFESKGHFKIRNIFWLLATVLFAVLMIYGFKVLVGTTQVPSGTVSFFVGWAPVSNCKLLMAAYSICLATLIYILIHEIFFKKDSPGPWLNRYYIPLIGFVMTTMWFAMYLNLSVMGPRYKLLLAPFLLMSCVFAGNYLIREKRIVHVLLVFAIFLSCLGSYGLFHPDKVQSHTYSFNELERSLEYRNESKMQQILAKTMEEEYASYHIGAPFVLAQMLTLPELGYVTKPLDVTVYGMSLYYGGIKNFSGLDQMPVQKSIWIGFTKKEFANKAPFPIDPQYDRVVREVIWGDKEAVLFQGGFAIERMRRIFEHVRSQKLGK